MSRDLNTILLAMRCGTLRRGGGTRLSNPQMTTRNLAAAEELERLAAQIEKLEGSAIHERVRDIFNRCVAADERRWLDRHQRRRIRRASMNRIPRRLRKRRATPRMVLRSAEGSASEFP